MDLTSSRSFTTTTHAERLKQKSKNRGNVNAHAMGYDCHGLQIEGESFRDSAESLSIIRYVEKDAFGQSETLLGEAGCDDLWQANAN